MESITYLLEHILEAPVILAWMESAKLSKVDRDLKREIYPTNILNVNSVIHQSQLNNNWKLNPTSQRDNSKILSVYKIAPHRSSRPEVFCQGRIQAVFEIGNRFWVHKNRHPNFDKSTKDIILTLFNIH